MIAILLAGTVYAGFQLFKEALNDQAESGVSYSAHHISGELSMQFAGRKPIIQVAATHPALADHRSTRQQEQLGSFVNKTAFAGASVVHSNDTLMNIVAGLSSDQRRALIGSDLSNRTYVQRAKGERPTSVTQSKPYPVTTP